MGKEINILAPELGFGSFGIAKVQVEITENEETISSRLYYFNIAEFSAFCDTVNTEFGSIHFGQHYIGLSNGDYYHPQFLQILCHLCQFLLCSHSLYSSY